MRQEQRWRDKILRTWQHHDIFSADATADLAALLHGDEAAAGAAGPGAGPSDLHLPLQPPPEPSSLPPTPSSTIYDIFRQVHSTVGAPPLPAAAPPPEALAPLPSAPMPAADPAAGSVPGLGGCWGSSPPLPQSAPAPPPVPPRPEQQPGTAPGHAAAAAPRPAPAFQYGPPPGAMAAGFHGHDAPWRPTPPSYASAPPTRSPALPPAHHHPQYGGHAPPLGPPQHAPPSQPPAPDDDPVARALAFAQRFADSKRSSAPALAAPSSMARPASAPLPPPPLAKRPAPALDTAPGALT